MQRCNKNATQNFNKNVRSQNGMPRKRQGGRANSTYMHYIHIYIHIYVYVCVFVCIAIHIYNLRKQKQKKKIYKKKQKKNSARHLLIIKFEIERTGLRVAIIDDKCCIIRKIPKNYERKKIVINKCIREEKNYYRVRN